MFSFILKLQELARTIRSNKKLWFTLVTGVGLLGTMITLLYLQNATDRAATKLYKYSYDRTVASLDNKMRNAEGLMLMIGSVIQESFYTAKPDVATMKRMVRNLASGQRAIEIAIIDQNNTTVAGSIPGIIVPEEVVDKSSGVTRFGGNLKMYQVFSIAEERKIVISHDFEAIQEEFEKEGWQVLILVNRDTQKMHELQQYSYHDVTERYFTLQKAFSNTLSSAYKHADKEEIDRYGFAIQDDFYIQEKVLSAQNGKELGKIIMAQDIQNPRSLVASIRSLSQQIIMAALGLVMALLILMI